MRFLASAAFLAALAWVAPAMAQVGPAPAPGACSQALCPFPAGHDTPGTTQSQAQLARQLRQEGYREIRTTAYEFDWFNSPPVLIPPLSEPGATHKG